ncbi:MAG: Peptidoglycan D,D-transpeptidase MrdA [Verrucomicrobia subdivision 3 bacterium]|nr:Peptidoglycan D,D-transpeptidase MrdA [Limisphaerales bacterium]MCS1413061.1 Peptidoglycan D,D-transpeptidase MrdA [Limisphaerales bacterium]
MYSVDRLQESDARMHWLFWIFILGFLILLGGLWNVQIVSFEKYERFREVQSYRTIRVPAIRGKILDRNGRLLADNRPNYGIVLYLEELRPLFQRSFKRERAKRSYSKAQLNELALRCRYTVVSNIWFEVTALVDQPMRLDRQKFERHYEDNLYAPLPIIRNLTRGQVARFVEKGARIPGVDLELQSLRHYPGGSLAAHLIGYLRKADPKEAEEEFKFSYHQPDYRGRTGIELIYDNVLRGEPGGKSVLINNLMYRQAEHIWLPEVPGDNLYLTLDRRIQEVAESALRGVRPKVMGSVVVMDVRNGDVLAMASAPTYDPNEFIGRLSQERWAELNHQTLRPLLNRASYGIYAPGSIFKIIVAMALLEDGGLDPRKPFKSLGYIRVKGRLIKDTAGRGSFDFYRALAKSSNPYFIHHGLEVGIEPLIKWGNQFFLGQATGLLPYQELRGMFPTMEDVRKGWHPGETANLCIGQGAVAVTPLQMAVMVSAVANRGTVYKPRIAARVEPQGLLTDRTGRVYPRGVVRGHLAASPEVFEAVHEAMRRSEMEGTGGLARISGFGIGGKTGTAETNKRIDNRKIKDTWFASFAPVEDPRYAVVVLVVDGISGRTSCAPVAQEIYEFLRDLDFSAEVSQRERPLARIVQSSESIN